MFTVKLSNKVFTAISADVVAIDASKLIATGMHARMEVAARLHKKLKALEEGETRTVEWEGLQVEIGRD